MDAQNQVAVLESLVDHLKAELSYLQELLIECGFPEGIATLKMTAEELIKEKNALEKSPLDI